MPNFELRSEYDPQVPTLLKKEQEWFGHLIGRPLKRECINSFSANGQPIDAEVAEHIVPSAALKPIERIQIYNQQYWWRLLNVLQEAFPMATHLLGIPLFNASIAVPYLTKYPPNHWSLNLLGKRLKQWLKEDWQTPEKDLNFKENAPSLRSLICDCIDLDWAFQVSFVAAQSPQTSECTEELLNRPCHTQPHLHLFALHYPLFRFREALLKEEASYWQEHSLPNLNAEELCHFVLYRNESNYIAWKEISHAEYYLLNLFTQGMSIAEACDVLEKQAAFLYDEAVEHLQSWFQEWTHRRWLVFHECT